MARWHDNTAFWKKTWTFQFDEQRWAKTAQYVKQIAKLVGAKKDMEILDLCCGPGRVSVPFGALGYKITGVDYVKAYLAHARKRAKKEKANCKFVHGDMRTYRCPETYDIVMNLFTSIGYFKDQEENQRVLDNVFASLKHGGKLILEIRSREIYQRIFRPKDWDVQGKTYLLKERIPSKDWTWLTNPWIVLEKGKEYRFDVSHYLYSAKDLTDMMKKSGFKTFELYGAFDGRPYDPKTSDNLVIVATKK